MEPKFITMLPLFAALALPLIGFLVYRRKRGPEVPGPGGVKPCGVHGFLALYVFLSYFIAPFVGFGVTMSSLREVEEANPSVLGLEVWSTYKMLCMLLIAGSIAWLWWVAYRLSTRLESSSVHHARLQLLAMPVLMVAADFALVQMLFNVGNLEEAAKTLVRSYVPSWIWLLYFIFSRRVKNTYLRGANAMPATGTLTAAT